MNKQSKYQMQSAWTRSLQKRGALALFFIIGLVFISGFFILASPANWTCGERPPLFPDVFFHAVRLFTADLPEHGMEHPTPPVLLVATLAIIVTLATVLQLVASSLTNGIILLQRKLCRNQHVIICGLSRKAHHLAVAYTKAGRKVVVIELDEQHPGIDEMLDLGAQIEFGDASDSRVLENADIGNASLLVCLAGQEANARIQHTNATLAKVPGKAVPAVLHIEDRHLYKVLQWYEFIRRARNAGNSVRIFNLADWGAEHLVRCETVPTDVPHYLVVGAGGLGQALVTGLTRKWMRKATPAPGERITFTLLDRDAYEQKALLEMDHGPYEAVWKLIPHAMDIRTAAFSTGAYLEQSDAPEITKVFVCLGNDGLSLLASLEIKRLLVSLGKSVPIVARVAENEGLLWADYMADPHTANQLDPYRILEVVMTKDLEHACATEPIAIALHNAYLMNRTKARAGAVAAGNKLEVGPAEVPWEILPEEYRESSRAQAASVEDALAALPNPRDIVICHEGQTAPSASPLTGDEIEFLAEREHDRWMAEKIAQGWTYAPMRDNDAKHHNNLLPWSELDEAAQQIDRDMVSEWTGALSAAKMKLAPKH